MLFVVVALRHFAKEQGNALGRRQPVENHRTALRGHGLFSVTLRSSQATLRRTRISLYALVGLLPDKTFPER
jgi:hypothetical protein